MSRVSTFLSYSFGDQVRLLSAAALLGFVSVALRIGSLSTVRRWLIRVGDVGAVRPGSGDASAERVANAVEAADNGLPGSRTCLVRSVTSESLLRAHGYTPTHRIGVNKQADDGMKAHSWLEYDGDVLIGDVHNLDEYHPLPPLSSDGSS